MILTSDGIDTELISHLARKYIVAVWLEGDKVIYEIKEKEQQDHELL